MWMPPPTQKSGNKKMWEWTHFSTISLDDIYRTDYYCVLIIEKESAVFYKWDPGCHSTVPKCYK